jgi:hypothetical protein
MVKTIALTSRFQKLLYIFMGIVFLFGSIRSVYQDDFQITGLLFIDIAFITTGIAAIIYGILLFWFSPQIQVDNTKIIYKAGIFKQPQRIDWSNVIRIGYNPYKIEFYLSDRTIKTLKIRSTAETTLAAKRSVREFAEMNQIDIKEK